MYNTRLLLYGTHFVPHNENAIAIKFVDTDKKMSSQNFTVNTEMRKFLVCIISNTFNLEYHEISIKNNKSGGIEKSNLILCAIMVLFGSHYFFSFTIWISFSF